MLDLVTTNETHFFREPQHFQFLEQQVFPAWTAAAAAGRRPRRVRAWSAACSTGQEVYTLAMLLLEHFPAAEGWDVRVTGTDLSTRVLETARAGMWPLHLAAEIPTPYRKKYMLRGTAAREGTMAAGAELRAVVDFRRMNLMDASYGAADCDLVFCRNVLIYFDPETRARVVERLAERLAPGGFLFLGHAEALNAATPRLRRVHPAIFRHAERPGR
jgi:chemotaxis protein methyltransferase CheR